MVGNSNAVDFENNVNLVFYFMILQFFLSLAEYDVVSVMLSH